jgi:hypothetical protein
MPGERPKLFELLASEWPEWDTIAVHLRDNPDDASYIDQETQQTALHLALACKISKARTLSRRVRGNLAGGARSSSSEQRRRVIKTLLALNPEATTVRCRSLGYTPLALACRSTCLDVLAEDAKVIRSLILANQRSVNVSCSLGLTPMLIHIKSVSRLKFGEAARAQKETSRPSPNDNGKIDDDDKSRSHEIKGIFASFTAILDMLARYSSQSQLEQALEMACQCNSLLILNLLSQEEANARRDMILFGLKEARTSSSLAGVWIWEWLLVVLRHVSNRLGNKPRSYLGAFYPLHVAWQTECPPSVLLLCLRAFPQDARAVLDLANLALSHSQIVSWTSDLPSGEQFSEPAASTTNSNCRKIICLKAIESGRRQVSNGQR